MLTRFQTNRMRALRKAFESWRLRSDAAKIIERLQKAIAAELAQKQNHSEDLIEQLKVRKEELIREVSKQQDLHERYEEVRQRIAEAEEKLSKQQSNARSRLSERSQEPANEAGGEQSEVELLREKEELYEHLLSENKKMKSNLTACETNLSGFISEMNSLLDQHEMGSILGQALMPHDSDLVALAGARPAQPVQHVNGGRDTTNNHEMNSNDDQLYSSQHDSVNERPNQRTQLGETGGGP